MDSSDSKKETVQYKQGSETVVTGTKDTRLGEGRNNHLLSSQLHQDTSSPGSRIWMFLTLAFIVISVVLLITLIVRESQKTSSSSSRSRPVVSEALIKPSEHEIISKYRSYFRTPEEQRVVAETFKEHLMTQNITKAPVDDTIRSNLNCSFNCTIRNRPTQQYQDFIDVQTGKIKRRLMSANDEGDSGFLAPPSSMITGQDVPETVFPSIYNGCCASTVGYKSPDNATIPGGELVTVVQLKSMRQYFPAEECRQAKLCIGCTCGHQQTFTSAVVSFNDTVTVKLISIEGCCKCFNNL